MIKGTQNTTTTKTTMTTIRLMENAEPRVRREALESVGLASIVVSDRNGRNSLSLVSRQDASAILATLARYGYDE